MQRRVVHEELPVDTHHVEETDIGLADGPALLLAEVILAEELLTLLLEADPHPRVTIQLVDQLLHVIETHRATRLRRALVVTATVPTVASSSRSRVNNCSSFC